MSTISSTKPTVIDEAFGEALLVVQDIQPPFLPEHTPLVSAATLHLLHEHLDHQLDHLAVLVAPLSANSASTIVYAATPVVIEALRRIAHNMRGSRFEEYVYENGITSEDQQGMIQAWRLFENIWGRAWCATVSVLLKFGNDLVEQKRTEELVKGKPPVDAVVNSERGESLEEKMEAEGYEEMLKETRESFEQTMEMIGMDGKRVWKELDEAQMEVDPEGAENDQEGDTAEDGKASNTIEQIDLVSNGEAYDDIDSHAFATAPVSNGQTHAVESANSSHSSHASNNTAIAATGNDALSLQEDKASDWDDNDGAATQYSSSQDSRRNDFVNHRHVNPALALPPPFPERLEAFGAALEARMRAVTEQRAAAAKQAAAPVQPITTTISVNPYLANLAAQGNIMMQANNPHQGSIPYHPFGSVPVSQPASAPSPPLQANAQAFQPNPDTATEGDLVRTLTSRKRPGHKRRERWVMEPVKRDGGW